MEFASPPPDSGTKKHCEEIFVFKTKSTQESLGTETKRRYKLAIVAPTCFYYQVDLFRQLAAHPRIDLTVYFCSDEFLHGQDIREMYQVDKAWGDESELLVGYQHKFLPNQSPMPSYLRWPYGLMNFSIWKEIKDNRPDAVILMSWMNITWWIAIAACLRSRIPILYMTDANVQSELTGPSWKKWFKKLFLKNMLFKMATGFLCAGTANRLLYEFYGAPEEKLVPFAYSWGYESHLRAWEDLKPRRAELRAQQGIADGSFVILYCGRLATEKRVWDLLEAYRLVNCKNKILVIVGSGGLQNEMQEHVVKHGLDSVRFLGFQTRFEVRQYYATADLLVLPSARETWGIVVNEALCYELPVIVSDQVGAGRDMVRDGENGFIYPSGDVEALTLRLQQVIDLSEEERRLMGLRSRQLIEKWVKRDLAQSLDRYIDFIYSNKFPGKI